MSAPLTRLFQVGFIPLQGLGNCFGTPGATVFAGDLMGVQMGGDLVKAHALRMKFERQLDPPPFIRIVLKRAIGSGPSIGRLR